MATISLCMIVKNEESVLGRCLDSALGVADEIIIADTGSSDATKETAARYTKQIFDVEWKDDFSAARNAAFARASMDYCMWLDADDVIQDSERQKLIKLKEELGPDVLAVMMKYATSFDSAGRPAFLFDRERLVRRDAGLMWEGRVHEVIDLQKGLKGGPGGTAGGRILYSDIRIDHRSVKQTYTKRNLNIYEAMLREGEALDARHQFYYGRELYYHGLDERAVEVFRELLETKEGGAWVENLADACRFCAICLRRLGKERQALDCLFHTFCYGLPRPAVCCEIGSICLDKGRLSEAEYWYRQAMDTPYEAGAGAFVEPQYQREIPALQLTVCLDRQGRYGEAERFNELAGRYQPDSGAVKRNREYFRRIRQKTGENPG